MCNNALKYNKSGTVYHKAARKLLHLGMRQLTPAKLRPLGSILTYMYEIPIRELGFDMGKMDVVSVFRQQLTLETVLNAFYYFLLLKVQFCVFNENILNESIWLIEENIPHKILFQLKIERSSSICILSIV